MRQLELFGFTEDEPKPPAAKEQPAVAIKQPPAEVVVAADKPAILTPAEEKEVIFIPLNLFSALEQESPLPQPKKAAPKIPSKRGRKSFKDIDAELNLVEVPDDDVLFKKLYYPISEVAKWFNVNTSLVRFWENEFDILKPRKNRKGDRLFRPEDIKNLQVIHYLLRQRKFSIEGAKKYLKQNKSKAEVNIQLIQSLTRFRSFLLEMKANLGA